MSYGDYSLRDIRTKLGITITERFGCFGAARPLEPSEVLRASLPRRITKAKDINTEKARSEYLVLPLLDELEVLSGERLRVFSGSEFTVDASLGLSGRVDFLLCGGSERLFVDAPVLAIVEAKNDNLKDGLSQCIATLQGAHLFNQREGRATERVGGAVTTGVAWQFLALSGSELMLDTQEYGVTEIARVLGILAALAGWSRSD
jgi:hypothetical protein